jgi:hypothetical protein
MVEICPGVLFLNIQPSSFEPGSYPVEIGHSSCAMKSRAYVVKPAVGWREPTLMEAAERGHGISFLEAEASGHAPEEVATALNRDFEGMRVFSARPEWDVYWLRRLHRAAEVTQAYDIVDWLELFGTLPDSAFHRPEAVDRLREEVRRRVSPGFRAVRASRYLACVWMCARDPKLLPALAGQVGMEAPAAAA